jgi:hypothetical protein
VYDSRYKKDVQVREEHLFETFLEKNVFDLKIRPNTFDFYIIFLIFHLR